MVFARSLVLHSQFLESDKKHVLTFFPSNHHSWRTVKSVLFWKLPMSVFGSISPSFSHSQQPPAALAEASKDDLLQVQLLSYLRGATGAPAHVPWTSGGPPEGPLEKCWNCGVELLRKGRNDTFLFGGYCDTEQKSCWRKIPCEKKNAKCTTCNV